MGVDYLSRFRVKIDNTFYLSKVMMEEPGLLKALVRGATSNLSIFERSIYIGMFTDAINCEVSVDDVLNYVKEYRDISLQDKTRASYSMTKPILRDMDAPFLFSIKKLANKMGHDDIHQTIKGYISEVFDVAIYDSLDYFHDLVEDNYSTACDLDNYEVMISESTCMIVRRHMGLVQVYDGDVGDWCIDPEYGEEEFANDIFADMAYFIDPSNEFTAGGSQSPLGMLVTSVSEVFKAINDYHNWGTLILGLVTEIWGIQKTVIVMTQSIIHTTHLQFAYKESAGGLVMFDINDEKFSKIFLGLVKHFGIDKSLESNISKYYEDYRSRRLGRIGEWL